MHQLGPIDIAVMAGVVAAGLVLERLARGRLHWLEEAFQWQKGLYRESHPTAPRGVQEDDDVRWTWSPRD